MVKPVTARTWSKLAAGDPKPGDRIVGRLVRLMWDASAPVLTHREINDYLSCFKHFLDAVVSTYSNELYGKPSFQSKPRADYLPLSAR